LKEIKKRARRKPDKEQDKRDNQADNIHQFFPGKN